MNVAMMQPTFLPWQGFFELISKSEQFVFLDDFQFSVQSYHQRNRLFVNAERIGWYTVPIRKSISFQAPLNETRIDETNPWRKKMWRRIQSNYSKAPYYEDIGSAVHSWLFATAQSLAEQNMDFIKRVCSLMGIEREFHLSSESHSGAKRSERVIELLRKYKADRYCCAQGSFEYMRQDGFFPVRGVEVCFQDFKPMVYKQINLANDFEPRLSVLDALMNVGPKVTLELIQNGTDKWLSWQEMINIKNSNSES
jgi:hypothetical protein|tara:strand:- start:3 stop:761 length:759 start_codon:yes stop_codon:yes gene_type:complete